MVGLCGLYRLCLETTACWIFRFAAELNPHRSHAQKQIREGVRAAAVRAACPGGDAGGATAPAAVRGNGDADDQSSFDALGVEQSHWHERRDT